MTEEYVKTFNLPKGLRALRYDSIEEIDKDAGIPGTALRLANERVWNWNLRQPTQKRFAEALEKTTGFKRVAGQNEVDYVNAFRAAVLLGNITGLTNDTVEAYLQGIADKIEPYKHSLKAEPTKVVVTKRALNRAEIIFNNGNAEKWWTTLRTEGIKIEEMSSDRNKNIQVLAVAIMEYMDKQADLKFA